MAYAIYCDHRAVLRTIQDELEACSTDEHLERVAFVSDWTRATEVDRNHIVATFRTERQRIASCLMAAWLRVGKERTLLITTRRLVGGRPKVLVLGLPKIKAKSHPESIAKQRVLDVHDTGLVWTENRDWTG